MKRRGFLAALAAVAAAPWVPPIERDFAQEYSTVIDFSGKTILQGYADLADALLADHPDSSASASPGPASCTQSPA